MKNSNLLTELKHMWKLALINESQDTYSIQVDDVREAVRNMLKAKVATARPNPKQHDEVMFNSEDKKAAVKWMLSKGGWDKEDIKDVYPELLH